MPQPRRRVKPLRNATCYKPAMTGLRPPYFELMPPDPACPYCRGEKPRPDWSFAGGVWCISLQERADRASLAVEEFHRVGLCGRLEFYRPSRPGPEIPPREAIWASHKAVVRRALEQGCQTVLIFEDDAVFRVADPAPRIARSLAKLPPDWNGLFLGHWPISGWFTGWGVMEVKSGLAHAWLANRPLLELLDSHAICDPRLRYTSIFGKGIDSALGSLERMFAIFPMIAVQREIESDNLSASHTRSGVPRRWGDKLRYRIWVIQRLPRYAEIVCALLSPVHWLWSRVRR